MKGLVSFNNVIYDNMGACVAIEKHFGKKAFLRYDKRVTIKNPDIICFELQNQGTF